jgi:DNA-binding transcriptional ArsR family regulator
MEFPPAPDTTPAEEPAPRVVGLDDEATGDVLAAISSDTARRLLAALHEEPDTASGLAERVDTSLGNATYHLGRMSEAGLLEVIDTVYSEKGREMRVYAPADRPLVVIAGDDDETTGLRERLARLLGAVGALAAGSLAVEYLLRDGPWLPSLATAGSEAGADAATTAATEATGAATGLPVSPGLLVLLGGLLVLGIGALGRRLAR